MSTMKSEHLTSKDWEGKVCTLRKANDDIVYRDDVLVTRDGTAYKIVGGKAPHKPGSTGYVYARLVQEPEAVFSDNLFYPGVFDCRWVRDEDIYNHNG